MTADNALIFEVKGTPVISFEVTIPQDATPDVRASLTRTFRPWKDLNLVRSSEQDQFAAAFPHNRMFINYAGTDTILAVRNKEIHYMNPGKESTIAVYSNDQFFIQSASGEKITKQLDYLDWDNQSSSARVKDNNFEITHTGNFKGASVAQELRYKDEQGNDRRIVLEKIARHLLLPGEKLLPDKVRVSANGQYTLKMQMDGNLVLWARDGQVMWATNTNGHLVIMADMQRNGNFLLTTIGPPAWQSKTKEAGSYLSVTDHGNIVLYRPDGLAVWQSNPAH